MGGSGGKRGQGQTLSTELSAIAVHSVGYHGFFGSH